MMTRKKIRLGKEDSLYRGPGQEATLHVQGKGGREVGDKGAT